MALPRWHWLRRRHPPSAPPVSMLHCVRRRWRDQMLVFRLHDQHGTRRQSKSKSMSGHIIRPPPVASLSPGVGRGLWLVIALTIIARARRSDGMRPCWCICVVGFGGRQIFRQPLRFVVKRGGLLTSSSACSGFAGPRVQVGLASFAKISRGVPEVPFWRG